MELESFEVEVSTYENGKRIPLGEGAHVTVRSTGSERATKVRERLWKPYATFREVKPEVLDLLNSRWIAQGILVEMVGFTIDGKTLDLDLTSKEDQERLVKILMRPEYKGFRNRIIGLALDETNFQASIDEDLEKKLRLFARSRFEWGEESERIVLAYIEDGDELPDRYANPPTLSVTETRYWRIFSVLKNDRQIASGLTPGVGPIMSTSIIDYMIRVDNTRDAPEIDRAVRMVQAIDGEYVAVVNKGPKTQ